MGMDRLRVMISKSLNFTWSVTVGPRLPVPSQCRQTLSMSKLGDQGIEFAEIAGERVFGADRLPIAGWALMTLEKPWQMGCPGECSYFVLMSIRYP
jgi:hypothetical protein